jgi:hypothetical protein
MYFNITKEDWSGIIWKKCIQHYTILLESVLWLKFGFGFIWCSFGGPEVVSWWKLIDFWNSGSA